jgi:hypothetical protein
MSVQLESVIGSVVSAVAQARRIADEESVAIAEYYPAASAPVPTSPSGTSG